MRRQLFGLDKTLPFLSLTRTHTNSLITLSLKNKQIRNTHAHADRSRGIGRDLIAVAKRFFIDEKVKVAFV
jgi:hypothetical protein